MRHLVEDENDFDSFFSSKMRKMEHRSWRSWRSWRPWSHGNDATGRSAEPHSLARTCEGSPVKLCESLVASTGAVDREFFLISELCELSQSFGSSWRGRKRFRLLFFTKNAQNGTQPMEPVEPRKRRHWPRRGASFHTRRGPGLREFTTNSLK